MSPGGRIAPGQRYWSSPMFSQQFPDMRLIFLTDRERNRLQEVTQPGRGWTQGPSRSPTLVAWTCDNWASALFFPSPPSEDQLPPGFPNIDMGPQLKVVERTRTATMLCAASGNPDPEITWFKDFLPVDPSASDGRIKQLRSGEHRWPGGCGCQRVGAGGRHPRTQALGADGGQKGRADVQTRRALVLGEKVSSELNQWGCDRI